jgi:hypothetical protein
MPPPLTSSFLISFFETGSGGPTYQRNRAALSRPAKSLRQSITSSHSAHASIVTLDRDGPTATEPSSLVGVTAVAAVASVVPLTVCRSPCIDPNATRSYVHTLSQTRRWRSNGHCANESQCNQCSRDQHGLSPFPVSVSSGKRREVCACSDGTSKEAGLFLPVFRLDFPILGSSCKSGARSSASIKESRPPAPRRGNHLRRLDRQTRRSADGDDQREAPKGGHCQAGCRAAPVCPPCERLLGSRSVLTARKQPGNSQGLNRALIISTFSITEILRL